jgi:hypothetical protein
MFRINGAIADYQLTDLILLTLVVMIDESKYHILKLLYDQL